MTELRGAVTEAKEAGIGDEPDAVEAVDLIQQLEEEIRIMQSLSDSLKTGLFKSVSSLNFN